MTDPANFISLMAITLGAIGQMVKDQSTLKDHSTKEQKYDEIKRIYDGYNHTMMILINQEPSK